MCMFTLCAGKDASGDEKRFGSYIGEVISLFFVVDCGDGVFSGVNLWLFIVFVGIIVYGK